MSTLWVREYSQTATGGSPVSAGAGKMPVAQEPGTDQSPVTFTTSAQSAAFATGTTFIGIIGSGAFHYVVGSNPTATTNALKVPANTLVFIGVTAGQKIAAIDAV